MKTIGLIGGMSWESTAVYYRLLNQMARERLGGLHSAQLLLWSFDFAQIEALQAAGDWAAATEAMVAAARRLERGGADGLVICTNTMHKMAGEVQAAVSIPLIHIGDATARAIHEAGARKPLLLATRYTMEQDFYKGFLRDRHGIDVAVPDEAGRTVVHDIIYNELCQGVVKPESKRAYLDVIARAQSDGIDGVIFGCTEVGLLLSPQDLDLPAFDTTALHARAALDFALSGD
ncbi:aspartate/glutamate racemase family protein [Dichotomicrobium thermohalophilum]|uniref:Aspartate racemase n=1 Tax=Dichotomicrobium thermohalophilum TaxID=933063 RepID=A0A397Q768_9HYPH|nr:aspartate/glutamate racemase family protein [Dichotomicrobium thermohalophilum]RIA56898.1 aspartate racemase [Dichotomicrobium thermohalophilum]